MRSSWCKSSTPAHLTRGIFLDTCACPCEVESSDASVRSIKILEIFGTVILVFSFARSISNFPSFFPLHALHTVLVGIFVRCLYKDCVVVQVQGQCNGTKRRSPVRPCFTDSVGISTRNRIQGIPIDEIGERRECGVQSREIFETRGNSIYSRPDLFQPHRQFYPFKLQLRTRSALLESLTEELQAKTAEFLGGAIGFGGSGLTFGGNCPVSPVRLAIDNRPRKLTANARWSHLAPWARPI